MYYHSKCFVCFVYLNHSQLCPQPLFLGLYGVLLFFGKLSGFMQSNHLTLSTTHLANLFLSLCLFISLSISLSYPLYSTPSKPLFISLHFSLHLSLLSLSFAFFGVFLGGSLGGLAFCSKITPSSIVDHMGSPD